MYVCFQDEIIPEDIRQKVEEEEKAKEMEDLYLPPRSRKTLQQIQSQQSDDEGDGGRRRKRRKNDDSESSDKDGSDDDKPKKRGRRKKEAIKGFTDAEVFSDTKPIFQIMKSFEPLLCWTLPCRKRWIGSSQKIFSQYK